MFKRVVLSSVLIQLLFTFNLFAQDNDSLSFNIERYFTLNGGIILQPTEIQTSKVKTPFYTLGFFRNDISAINASTTADLFSSSGQIAVQKSQQGGGSPILRGFEANKIALMVDGIKLNNLIYRGGHLQNILSVESFLLERAQVVFGPTSLISGSDALGGTIIMETRKASFATTKVGWYGDAFTKLASAANESSIGVVTGYRAKRFSQLTGMTIRKFGDLRSGKNQNPFYDKPIGLNLFSVKRINGIDSLVSNSKNELQINSGYHQIDLLQKFKFATLNNFQHEFNLQFSTTGNVPRYDRLTDPKGNGLKYAEWYYGPQTRSLFAYTFSTPFSTEKTINRLVARFAHQYINESRHTRNFSSLNLDHRNEAVNVISTQIEAFKLVKKQIVKVGIDANFNFLKSTAHRQNIETTNESKLDTRYPDGTNYLHTAGIYFIGEDFKFGINNLKANFGARLNISDLYAQLVDNTFFNFPYSEIKQRNISAVYSLHLNYSIARNFEIYLQSSSSYRTPNIDDVAKIFESSNDRLIVPNENLKPEKAITIETGFNVGNDEQASFVIKSFYTRLLDAITISPFSYNGNDSTNYNGSISSVFAAQNTQEGFIYGGEFLLKSPRLGNDNTFLNFNGALTYTYGRLIVDEKETPLDHIPPVVGNFNLNFTYKSNWSLRYAIQFNGWKRLDDYSISGEDNLNYATPDGMPAWLIHSVFLNYQVNKSLMINTGIENIGDIQYRTFASGINAPERNFSISVRFNFD